ncbi:MAG: transposase [Candidatus Promineifilaceae bacterium]
MTICTHRRVHLFKTPPFHDLAMNMLLRVPTLNHAQHVRLDEWVVMPNHIHVILEFHSYPSQVGQTVDPEISLQNALAGSLGVIVSRYKSSVTTRINKLRRSIGGKVWHRGYYERIIRNERHLNATRQYIKNNPLRWNEDRENLNHLLSKMTHHA